MPIGANSGILENVASDCFGTSVVRRFGASTYVDARTRQWNRVRPGAVLRGGPAQYRPVLRRPEKGDRGRRDGILVPCRVVAVHGPPRSPASSAMSSRLPA